MTKRDICYDVQKLNVSDDVKNKLQKRANIIARKNGHGKATNVVTGTRDKVVGSVEYGYRKITTDEYVSNAYRNNFGWKNTYYQGAVCIIELKMSEPIK